MLEDKLNLKTNVAIRDKGSMVYFEFTEIVPSMTLGSVYILLEWYFVVLISIMLLICKYQF